MSEKQNDVYMVESQDTPSDQNQQEQTEAQRARFLSLDSPTPGQEPGEIYADPNKGSTQDEHKSPNEGGVYYVESTRNVNTGGTEHHHQVQVVHRTPQKHPPSPAPPLLRDRGRKNISHLRSRGLK